MCDYIYCKNLNNSNVKFLMKQANEQFQTNVGGLNSGFGYTAFIGSHMYKYKWFIDATDYKPLREELRQCLNETIVFYNKEYDQNTVKILFHFRWPTPKINGLTSNTLDINFIRSHYIQPFIKKEGNETYVMVHKGEIKKYLDKVKQDSGSDSYLFFKDWPKVMPEENDGPVIIIKQTKSELNETIYNGKDLEMIEDFIYTKPS